MNTTYTIMFSDSRVQKWAIFLLFLCFSGLSIAAESGQRVQPPQWSQDVLDAFFDDAREQLVGTRPLGSDKINRTLVAGPVDDAPGASSNASSAWSALIEADTLTAEVKRISNQLAIALRKSSGFQGGGNLACRRDFGLLSVLFGIIAEFDQEVRWQSNATQLQTRCFQAGLNCKVASAQSYAAANEALSVLQDLVRGQPPEENAADQQADGSLLVDRTQIMLSMELLLKERLSPALANSREFRKRSQAAAEQAQLLAALAEVIQQEGYEYADDDTFLDEARQLRESARKLTDAAREKNYEAARAAAGKVSQSCSRCHEGYRG